jgi:hypothetical protein
MTQEEKVVATWKEAKEASTAYREACQGEDVELKEATRKTAAETWEKWLEAEVAASKDMLVMAAWSEAKAMVELSTEPLRLSQSDSEVKEDGQAD